MVIGRGKWFGQLKDILDRKTENQTFSKRINFQPHLHFLMTEAVWMKRALSIGWESLTTRGRPKSSRPHSI
jgi:hypothetical protein